MPVRLFRGSTTGLRDKRDYESARKTFEDEINEFLSNPQIEVIDIKFTAVGEPDIKYPPRLYALVYYKIKAGEQTNKKSESVAIPDNME